VSVILRESLAFSVIDLSNTINNNKKLLRDLDASSKSVSDKIEKLKRLIIHFLSFLFQRQSSCSNWKLKKLDGMI
jgi:hypothetical protein